MNESLVVMDYSVGEIHIYPIETDTEMDIDTFLKEHNHNPDDCSYMFTYNARIVKH